MKRTLLCLAVWCGAVCAQEITPALYLDFDRPFSAGYADDDKQAKVRGNVAQVDGIVGKGVQFDGGDFTRIEVAPSSGLDITGDLTVGLWYKPTELAISTLGKRGEQDLLFRDWNWRLRLSGRGITGATIKDQNDEEYYAEATYEFPVNVWKHAALVYSSHEKTLTLYVDGFKIKSVPAKGDPLNRSTGPLVLGGGNNSHNSFNGVIDEVKIFDRALTPAEIRREMIDSINQVEVAPGVTKEQVDRENDRRQKAAQLAGKTLSLKELIPFQIAPFSNIPHLPEKRPADGTVSETIVITAAQNEKASASFILNPLKNFNDVTFTVSDLSGVSGTIPASSIRLRTVKAWYQADVAWRDITVLNHGPRVKVPELLLHDDDLIRVDDATFTNHARLDGQYRDISSPELVGTVLHIPVSQFPIKDAATLQPVQLKQDEYKQFWLTLTLPPGVNPGDYQGVITIKAGNESLGDLKLALKVLPFELPMAKTHYNPQLDFVSSIYSKGTYNPKFEPGIDIRYRSLEQLAEEYKNLKDHNITTPMVYQLQWNRDMDDLQKVIDLYKKAGLSLKSLYLLGPESNLGYMTDISEANIAAYRKRAKELRELAARNGFGELFIYGIDEAHELEMYQKEREFFKAAHQEGVKVFVSVAGLNKPDRYIDAHKLIGDLLDQGIVSAASNPVEAARWHKNGKKLWMYGDPQSGVEDPEINRRNFGIKLWRDNYDGFATYIYYGGFGNPWNDFDNIYYRDHNYVYPTADGVVDTIAWEAVSAAVDDIRYATLLRQLADANPANPVSREALNYLAQVDIDNGNLDEIRKRIIDFILQLLPDKK